MSFRLKVLLADSIKWHNVDVLSVVCQLSGRVCFFRLACMANRISVYRIDIQTGVKPMEMLQLTFELAALVAGAAVLMKWGF